MPIKPENQFFKTRSQIENWLFDNDIKDYILHKDLSVSVKGDVRLIDKKLKYLPIQFLEVGGDFFCQNNALNTLRGAPHTVNGDFFAFKNRLTSLKFAPSNIGGSLDLCENKLTTLDYFPSHIKKDIKLSSNHLVSLKGMPEKVNGNFTCDNNDLVSLEFAPQIVERHFRAEFNQLRSLEFGPIEVGGHYIAQHNQFENLLYIPKTVGGRLALGRYKNKNLDEATYQGIYNLHKTECIIKEKQILENKLSLALPIIPIQDLSIAAKPIKNKI